MFLKSDYEAQSVIALTTNYTATVYICFEVGHFNWTSSSVLSSGDLLYIFIIVEFYPPSVDISLQHMEVVKILTREL